MKLKKKENGQKLISIYLFIISRNQRIINSQSHVNHTCHLKKKVQIPNFN